MKALFLFILSAIVAVLLIIAPSVVHGEMTVPWPLVSTSPAMTVTNSSAILNGNLTRLTGWVPCALVSFLYGEKSGEYTSETAQQLRCDNGTFVASISNLKPCTTYYVVAKAARPEITGIIGDTEMHGAGVGLYNYETAKKLFGAVCTVYGNEITFKTTGCWVGPLGPVGSGGMGTNYGTSPSLQSTVQMSNIIVQSAAVTTAKVSPGQCVDVAASVTNKGTFTGEAKITLFVNGQEMESQGVILSAGQSTPMHFYVSMNEPGTYTVHVGSVPAGSFTVDTFANNDILIYGIIALFTLGIGCALYLVTRKRAT
jgi:hypothetical protein